MKIYRFISKKNKKQTAKSSESNPTLIALLSGFTGAALSLVGQYFINYQYIERPKIILEQTKQEVEVFKSVQSIQPRGSLSCFVGKIKSTRVLVTCDFKNEGSYDVTVEIKDFAIYDAKKYMYYKNNEDKAKLDNDFERGSALPGYGIRFFFYVTISEKALESIRNAHWYRLSYNYSLQTNNSVVAHLTKIMPRLSDLISSISILETGRMIDIDLSSNPSGD